jgi:hypothetical protein
MSHDSALAVGARWRERMDRAFKTIEHMSLVVDGDRERFVVMISANFAGGHGNSPGFRFC